MLETEPTRMPLTSADLLRERIDALRELFPEVFTEDQIDFERLKLELGGHIADSPERYGLTWPGKVDAIRAVQTPSTGTLIPMPEESVNFDTAENLIIEGDNLEVLKLLQKSYHGKVKMIYIDPPYNTGKEFIYPDNFREGLQDYLRWSGQVDDRGLHRSTNTESSGRYHSNWLTMMYPRLYLSRNLLREDGYIFVSIDDHELSNLIQVLDEIYGEPNRLAVMTWRGMHTTRNSAKGFNKNTEYIVCYGRNVDSLLKSDVSTWLRVPRDKSDSYPHDDDDGKGPYKYDPLSARNYYKPYTWTFSNGIVWSAPPGRYPAYSPDTLGQLEADGEIYFGGKTPQVKRYLNRVQQGVPPDTLLPSAVVGFSKDGTAELSELFNGEKVFDQPKPTSLISYLLTISREIDRKSGNDDLILDFFAGSGTTGQAVIEANRADGGLRKFILIQLPESVPGESPVRELGMETISNVAIERTRRFINKQSDQYLDRHNQPGFRTFRLSSSNFITWSQQENATELNDLELQIQLHIDHLLPDRSQHEILYELILKAGLSLTAQIQYIEVAEGIAYLIDGDALLICLEPQLDQKILDAIIDLEPIQVICLDSAFQGNDQLKTNTILQMMSHNIEFRTV